jgi:hypothetical protein
MLIPLNKATLAQLKAFADLYGIDYGDLGTGLPATGKLRARLSQSGLVKDGSITVEDAVEPVATNPSAVAAAFLQQASAADREEEVLPDAVFEKIASALWTTAARKVGDVYFPPEIKIPVGPKEAMRLAVAYRNAARVDPRNPIPGKAHGDKVTILIPQQDVSKGGDIPVFANYNEHATQIGRGQVVTVDWETACALAHAKMDSIKQLDGGGYEIVGKVQSFPFQVMADA